MKNISREDYVIWNIEDDIPVEDLDIVYHYTSIIELINDGGLKLQKNEELISVAELSLTWQGLISDAIEKTK
jgi:hypothetical protein